MFKKIYFKGPQQGINILILGAVHGNETAGTLAQQEIIQSLEKGVYTLQAGSVTFIPIVNEEAYQKDIRGVDENLNRLIKYHEKPQNNEEKIANLLIKEIEKADVLLDLHSTHCPTDQPFAFIDHPYQENLDFLKIIPVQTALAGWPEIYQNCPEIENNCTEEYAFLNKTLALTVECGYHKAECSVQTAKQSILNTLIHFGVLKGAPVLETKKTIIQLQNFVIKEKEGTLSKNYAHLDKIQKGEEIAVYETGEKLFAPCDGFIIMPNHGAKVNTEWFYFGKKS
ncbi:MAG: succinylglutamate desuccinylase/aspartoacylase family protein [Alphaproteobacteria bacterium]|nr:succinylglutamate desuccinylase/aspartoacylase family protein [Alphaproteobacteria bacterium]